MDNTQSFNIPSSVTDFLSSAYNHLADNGGVTNTFSPQQSIKNNSWWWLGSLALGFFNTVCLKIVGVAIATRFVVSYLMPETRGTAVLNKLPFVKDMRDSIWSPAIFGGCILAATVAPVIGWAVAGVASMLMISKDLSPHQA